MIHPISRRQMLKATASAALALNSRSLWAQTGPQGKRLGICSFSLNQHLARGPAELKQPLGFFEYCQRLGAGGVQMAVPAKDAAQIPALRRKLEQANMFIEGQARLPKDELDLERFERELRLAKEAGATVVRTACLSGRRYETFETAQAFQAFAKSSWQSLVLSEPVARRNAIRLAVENHKDWRTEDLIDWMRKLSSEFIGVCVDTGNNIALLEEPTAVVEALAPWAYSVHLKDMGVQEYDEGFLLSEVRLGEGFLDLRKMIELLAKAKPEIQFCLEMITRDPLKVPCLTGKYWATFETLPGRRLAQALSLVRANTSKSPLPRISHLPLADQLRHEEANVVECLRYAHDRLAL